MTLTPERRSFQAATAAHAMWARCPDRSARMWPAHRGLEARIARDYGIPADLPAAEFAMRIGAARKAYFRRLALKSAKVRTARKARAA